MYYTCSDKKINVYASFVKFSDYKTQTLIELEINICLTDSNFLTFLHACDPLLSVDLFNISRSTSLTHMCFLNKILTFVSIGNIHQFTKQWF